MSQRGGKYITDAEFVKTSEVLCDVSEDSINEDVILKIQKAKVIPIYSLEYLVSENYSKINVVHRMTLALHIVEGIFSQGPDSLEKQNLRTVYNIPPGISVGDYFVYLHRLCEENLFNYDSQYDYEVLKALDVDRYTFLSRLADTRNWYSHFLANDKKQTRIQNGDEYWFYFELLVYMIRLQLIKELGLQIDDADVKEFFYSVRDWIFKTRGIDGRPWKSKAYQLLEFQETIREVLTEQTAKNESSGQVGQMK